MKQHIRVGWCDPAQAEFCFYITHYIIAAVNIRSRTSLSFYSLSKSASHVTEILESTNSVIQYKLIYT